MLKMGRWMEVLKKMMHHRTFMLLLVSGGRRRVSVCARLSSVSSCLDVWDDGYVNIECVCARVCVKMLTLGSSS